MISVGLPDEGVFDVRDRFTKKSRLFRFGDRTCRP